ncbi:hypothetical protein MMC25_006741 [Agyrium rufum]|nr:hypothetical protein [Agyrium rufum]
MQCDICLRAANSRRPHYCPTCALAILYEPRLQHVNALLEKEALAKEVERAFDIIKPPPTDGSLSQRRVVSSSADAASRRVAFEDCKRQQLESIDRRSNTQYHTEALKDELKEMREHIAKRRVWLMKRRSALSSAQKQLTKTHEGVIPSIERQMAETKGRWELHHATMAESGVFLGKETASLYGLRRRKRKQGASDRDSYTLAGLPIIDLRDLNNVEPNLLTVSTWNVSHIVYLASHYLSLRLPAEISPPNSIHPYPTISSPLSSYRNPTLPLQPPLRQQTSSAFSNTPKSLARSQARALLLNRPLPVLAREDQRAYSLFVDAVTLLAWDVAWLCKVQGHDIGEKNWEDVCSMGRNLYTILVNPPPEIPRSLSALSKQNLAVLAKGSSTSSPTKKESQDVDGAVVLAVRMGHFSHNSNLQFLAGAEGSEYMRSWKLFNPVRVIEKVKGALASERMGAEWELLEEDEWVGEPRERMEEENGVVVAKEDTLATGGDDGTVKPGGNSGWTKLRSRVGEP